MLALQQVAQVQLVLCYVEILDGVSVVAAK